MKKIISIVFASVISISAFAVQQIPIANDFTGWLIGTATNAESFKAAIGVSASSTNYNLATSTNLPISGIASVSNLVGRIYNSPAPIDLPAGVVTNRGALASGGSSLWLLGTNLTGVVSTNDDRPIVLSATTVAEAAHATNADSATLAINIPWEGVTGVENVLTNGIVYDGDISLSAANSGSVGHAITLTSGSISGSDGLNGGDFNIYAGAGSGLGGTGGNINLTVGGGETYGKFIVNGNSLFNGTISDQSGVFPPSNILLTNGADGSTLTGITPGQVGAQPTNANLTALAAGTLAQNNGGALTNVNASSLVGASGSIPMGLFALGSTNNTSGMSGYVLNGTNRWTSRDGQFWTNIQISSIVGHYDVAQTNGSSYGLTNNDTFTAYAFRTINGTNFYLGADGNATVGKVILTNGSLQTLQGNLSAFTGADFSARIIYAVNNIYAASTGNIGWANYAYCKTNIGGIGLYDWGGSQNKSFSANSIIIPGTNTVTAPAGLVGMGAQLWSDGTNLCVVLQNAAGTRTTNKVTLTAWP